MEGEARGRENDGLGGGPYLVVRGGLSRGHVLTCSCLTLCDPCTVVHQAPFHGILQARMLEWVAISSSRGSS